MAKKKRVATPKKSNHTLLYAGIAVLIVSALALYLSDQKSDETLPVKADKVVMIEFLKFDCIHCYNLNKEMPSILRKYEGRLNVTYIPVAWVSMPGQSRGQSTKSIEAYIIAAQMGKGDEMRDALFEAKFVKNMDVMESTLAIEEVAASIGLGAEFKEKLEKGSAKPEADQYIRLMSKYNVQGTPTVILNEKVRVDPPTASNIDSNINSLLI